MSGDKKQSKWYLKNLKPFFIPKEDTLSSLEEEQIIDEYYLKGFVPDEPIINKNDKIITFGSCFASTISSVLYNMGFNTGKGVGDSANNEHIPYLIRFGGGMNNTYVVKEHLEWALEGRDFTENLWHDKNGKTILPFEEIRQSSKELLVSSDVVVITFGISEVWRNNKNNETFWRAVPYQRTKTNELDATDEFREFSENMQEFKGEDYSLVVTTCQENINNLEEIYSILRKYCKKDLKIIFTVSPIRTMSTFRSLGPFVASCATKSTLRTAIDEVWRSKINDKNFFYWPGYEIVKEFCNNPYECDERHIKPEIVNKVVNSFVRNFCKKE